MSNNFQYDVFISHSSGDKPAVLELAERLKADGLRVWLDEWQIQPGDMIGLKINQGLEQSRTLLLVMSANASESEWVKFESQTILFNDPTNQQRRFIPLRLDDSEIKDTLKQFAHIDWRQKSDEQYANLLNACHPQVVLVESAIKQKGHPLSSKVLKGSNGFVLGVGITADGRRVISGSRDRTVRIWDVETGECLATLEGHTQDVYPVAISADGRRAVSGSLDNTMRVWELPPYKEKASAESEATRYTNAKVLLVGETGVGKSGLAYRLTEDRFVQTISTDGVWATQMKLQHETSSAEIEREIWLWDFAGH